MNPQSRMHLDAGATNEPVAPRLLTASQAAAYLGCKSTSFLANLPVKPLRLAEVGPGTRPRYDRKALDLWLDGLSGLTVGSAQETASKDEAEGAFKEWSLRRVSKAV